MENVIVIAGPTASGKTSLSIALAKKINGEIISADSMQVYKYMDIGTAKPTMEEMQGIKHYLIDEITPDKEFSVAKYQKLAIDCIDKILKKSRVPIIVGGTGLYINSLIYNIQFMEIDTDWDLRQRLLSIAERHGNKYLHDQLREIDANAAKRIHVNDTKRIIRAIEVYRTTNRNISYHHELSKSKPPAYNFIVFGLRMDRQKLYDKINKRVDLMIDTGLINEVKELVKMGYDKYFTAMQGLGYKEVLWYLRGRATLKEVTNLIKRDTRRYAKRQLTWFNKINDMNWLNACEEPSRNIAKILSFYKNNNSKC